MPTPKDITQQNKTILSPSPGAVDENHLASDVDSSKVAQHHTIGIGANQSSSGNHKHQGDDSLRLDATAIQQLVDGGVTYTPTWTASTTNPTIGNGSVNGRYIALGKLIFVAIRVNFGSTTNAGTGLYMFGLPFPSPSIPVNWLATGVILNGGKTFSMTGYTDSAQRINAMYDASGNRLSAVGVFGTWASGDFILLSTAYESA